MARNVIHEVENDAEARSHARFITQRIMYIPSMSDKLPKYILEPLQELQRYVEKEGWECMRDDKQRTKMLSRQ